MEEDISGLAILPTYTLYGTRSHLQTHTWPMSVWISLACWKVFHKDASHFFIPFPSPLQSFQPLCFCSSWGMEIFMISGMCFKAWLLEECFKFFIWEKWMQSSKWSYTLDTVLFSLFSFFLLVLGMNNNKNNKNSDVILHVLFSWNQP